VLVGAAHRIANTATGEPLVLIEVQRGDHLGEDDIVRLCDGVAFGDKIGHRRPSPFRHHQREMGP
jgi:hypothetical protein